MKYYRVPRKLDGRAVCGPGNYTGPVKRYLVGNELYTEKECSRYGITLDGLEAVEIPKTRIFWFFGARFEFDNGPTTEGERP